MKQIYYHISTDDGQLTVLEAVRYLDEEKARIIKEHLEVYDNGASHTLLTHDEFCTFEFKHLKPTRPYMH